MADNFMFPSKLMVIRILPRIPDGGGCGVGAPGENEDEL